MTSLAAGCTTTKIILVATPTIPSTPTVQGTATLTPSQVAYIQSMATQAARPTDTPPSAEVPSTQTPVVIYVPLTPTPPPPPPPSPTTHTIAGTMRVIGVGGHVPDPSPCFGTGGFSDINAGAQVVVKDGAGNVLAVGELGEGQRWIPLIHYNPLDCMFAFTVTGVPDAPFYSVEVSHRGALTYAGAVLEAKSWTLDLSLGSCGNPSGACGGEVLPNGATIPCAQ
jgi:hypothetical protein